jgi:acyl-CoA synthetase (AMP-forming)/AMP-acid ligase II
MLSAAALDAHVAASAAVLPPLGPGDRWLVCLPMTSIGALAALWRTLSAGACLGLLEHFDAGEARRFMAAGASHVSIVPAMLAPLADAVAPEPRGLRCLLSGGGPLSAATAAIAHARGWPLWNGWGMTETCSHVAVGPVDAHWQEGVVGRPLPGVALELEAPDGRLGIRGPMLMSGYARPGLAPGDGLEADGRFRSGDLGEFLADGALRVTGRADDVIVTGGANVHPQAIEQALEGCPGAAKSRSAPGRTPAGARCSWRCTPAMRRPARSSHGRARTCRRRPGHASSAGSRSCRAMRWGNCCARSWRRCWASRRPGRPPRPRATPARTPARAPPAAAARRPASAPGPAGC